MPHGFVRDAKLSTVSFSAGFLFLALVDVAQESNSRGWLTLEQVAAAGHRLKNLKRYLKELCDAVLIRWEPSQSKYVIVDADKWRTSARNHGPEPALNQPRTSPEPALNGPSMGPEWHPIRPTTSPERSIRAAGQSHVDNGSRAQGCARSPAGAFEVPSTKWTDGTPNAGRDAPRSGGGAARPARKTDGIRAPWDPPDGDTIAGAASIADIRKTLDKAKKSNPNSTGKDAPLSNYDPDRPTTPITSAMVWKANKR